MNFLVLRFPTFAAPSFFPCPIISKLTLRKIKIYSVFSRFFIFPVHCSFKNIINSVSVNKIDPKTLSKHKPPMLMWMKRFNQPLSQQNICSETAVIMKENDNDSDTIFDGNMPRRGFRLELMKNFWMNIELRGRREFD